MRLGAILTRGNEASMARAAEQAGLFGALAGFADPSTSINAAIYAATATSALTIAVRIELGCEHPITVSEEIAVLDNVSNGRLVVLADSGELERDRALEELEIIRHALACRAFAFSGTYYNVPAGISTNVPESSTISVTPKPAQINIPFWAMGEIALDRSRLGGAPMLAFTPADCDPSRLVQPAVATFSGSLNEDRDCAAQWAEAGATHLFVEAANEQLDWQAISRFIVPEVAMPNYPRMVSEASPPLPWSPDGR